MACAISDMNAAAVALERARKVATVSHRRPDGDTAGSALALAACLEAQGKEVACFCADQLSAVFSYLPGCGRISQDPSVLAGADLLVVIDCGDLRFAGLDDILPKLSPRPLVLNIDHHAVNEEFGDVNLVDGSAASATEVVFALLKSLGYPITPEIATCLLTGIATDTMIFFNPATSASSMRSAAELQRLGGDMKRVFRAITKQGDIGSLVVWGRALERLKFDPARSRASTMLRVEDFSGPGAIESAADGLSNFLNNNLSAKIVTVLRELAPGMVKGSIRTAHDDVDVSAEAKALGGGGHRKAAGFVVKGRIVERESEWAVETAN